MIKTSPKTNAKIALVIILAALLAPTTKVAEAGNPTPTPKPGTVTCPKLTPKSKKATNCDDLLKYVSYRILDMLANKTATPVPPTK